MTDIASPGYANPNVLLSTDWVAEHLADKVIAHCRIGERSSHSWFVLTHLLGFPNVRNYDGSWTEWGNLVNVPVER